MSFYDTKVPDVDFLIKNSQSKGYLKKIISRINNRLLTTSDSGKQSILINLKRNEYKKFGDFIKSYYKHDKMKIVVSEKMDYVTLTFIWRDPNDTSNKDKTISYTVYNEYRKNNSNGNTIVGDNEYNGNIKIEDDEILGL